MENKAHAIAAGVFVRRLVAALVLALVAGSRATPACATPTRSPRAKR